MVHVCTLQYMYVFIHLLIIVNDLHFWIDSSYILNLVRIHIDRKYSILFVLTVQLSWQPDYFFEYITVLKLIPCFTFVLFSFAYSQDVFDYLHSAFVYFACFYVPLHHYRLMSSASCE